jgi:adenylylsulfate kinase-like enzyme
VSIGATTGLVVWITGLPCSGKTSVARELARVLRASDATPCIVLDGDELRPAIAEDLGYSMDARRRCAWRYARLAAALARQNVCVLVATVSPFAEIRRWTHDNARDYFEVFLRVPRAIRHARDQRGIYRQREVVGEDLPFTEPATPHLTIDDDGTRDAIAIARHIAHLLATRTPPATDADPA